ncbi:hypothetical protein [Azospirillum argentinense]|uniref:Uncharacterized protein n=1 Tax=Azospirillum brasilense TaxID=192 RepID=A0A4D8Q5S0_AZOBR|nr:hypothetical protein [Azospirillum argentinense]QCO05474.1 hypothetical protein D3867_26385 [Azospirillum argentinense]
MLIVGADPGLSGALALLSERGLERVEDMPVLELTRGGKAKREPDLVQLSLIVGGWAALGVDAAYVEQVGSMPEQGISSAFAFGKVYGALLGVLHAHQIPTFTIIPATWKKGVGIKAGSGKDASRALAKQLWPAHGASFARVKDDGRAEAALIGWYGVRKGGER